MARLAARPIWGECVDIEEWARERGANSTKLWCVAALVAYSTSMRVPDFCRRPGSILGALLLFTGRVLSPVEE